MVSVDAFAPGHLTGLFVPSVTAENPLARGSCGAGFVLDLGARAHAEVRPAAPGRGSLRVTQAGLATSLAITERALHILLAPGSHEVHVDLVHDLPVSQGFGMSAAGTVAATLAVAHALGKSPSAAYEASHLAELDLHGGLGGVAAILGGGVEVRRSPGLPPFGRIERTPLEQGLFVGTYGPALPSPPLLSDPQFLHRVTLAGERLLDEVPAAPVPWDPLLQLFERFTDTLSLATPPMQELLVRCRNAGCRAAQAMLGNTFFVWAPDYDREERLLDVLRRAHVAPRRVHVGTSGARILSRPPPS
jgi:pantoate kinase